MAAPMRPAMWQLRRAAQLQFGCSCSTIASSSVKSPPEGSLAEQFKIATAKSKQNLTCRTSENNPVNHTRAHEGLFYTVPELDFKRWLQKGLHVDHYRMIKAFTECSFMVRKPALEIIDCLQATNYQLPAIRYILYGRSGSGKTCSLAHIIHRCGVQGWMVLHVPWAAFWNRYIQDHGPSTYKENRIDLPIEAADWLINFKRMNDSILREYDLRTTKNYTWSRREVTEEGAPWSEAIEFALGRTKYASDCVGLILREACLQAAEKNFKVLVAVDGVNAFWDNTIIKREDQSVVPAEQLSLVHHFKKLLLNDWRNGAIVCTVDEDAGDRNRKGSYLPRYLLGTEGFELLDPHIPIHVEDYSDKEIHSCLQYYIDRKWLSSPQANTEMGKKELIFLSCQNPRALFEVTSGW